MFTEFVLLILVRVVINQEIEFYASQSLTRNEYKASASKTDIETQNRKETYRFGLKNKFIWRDFKERFVKENETESKVAHHTTKKSGVTDEVIVHKRETDTVFRGYPKTREELWHERFLYESASFDQTPSLIHLLHNITLTYLKDCTTVLLYDSQVKSKDSYLFQNLLKDFPVSFVHGFINDQDKLQEPKLLQPIKECLHYIIFLYDIRISANILGKQSESKVVIVSRSSQWAVQEFLAGPLSRMFVNLLVIGQSFKDGDDSSLVSFLQVPVSGFDTTTNPPAIFIY